MKMSDYICIMDYLLGCAGPSEELRVYTDPLLDPTVVSDRIRHNK